MTKRIMRSFLMKEISAVDRPAQAGARMTIMKRDDSADEYWKRDFSDKEREQLASSGAALPDGSFPVKSTQDLKNAIQAVGRAKDPAKAKAHIISRAKSLGATDSLPDDWKVGKSHGDIDMTQDEVSEMIAKAVKAATDPLNATIAKMGGKKGKPAADDDSYDNEPDGDEDTKKAWRDYAKKLAEKAVAKAKEELETDFAKRAEIAKGDEMLEIDGKTIRKSEAGEGTFAMLKSLHEDREIASFTKRAETEIVNLPGEAVAKAKALRAVSKLAKEDRETVEAMLKAGSEAMKKRFGVIGQDGGGEGTADGELSKLAKAYAVENKVSEPVALAKILETTEGRALYAKSVSEKPRAAA